MRTDVACAADNFCFRYQMSSHMWKPHPTFKKRYFILEDPNTYDNTCLKEPFCEMGKKHDSCEPVKEYLSTDFQVRNASSPSSLHTPYRIKQPNSPSSNTTTLVYGSETPLLNGLKYNTLQTSKTRCFSFYKTRMLPDPIAKKHCFINNTSTPFSSKTYEKNFTNFHSSNSKLEKSNMSTFSLRSSSAEHSKLSSCFNFSTHHIHYSSYHRPFYSTHSPACYKHPSSNIEPPPVSNEYNYHTQRQATRSIYNSKPTLRGRRMLLENVSPVVTSHSRSIMTFKKPIGTTSTKTVGSSPFRIPYQQTPLSGKHYYCYSAESANQLELNRNSNRITFLSSTSSRKPCIHASPLVSTSPKYLTTVYIPLPYNRKPKMNTNIVLCPPITAPRNTPMTLKKFFKTPYIRDVYLVLNPTTLSKKKKFKHSSELFKPFNTVVIRSATAAPKARIEEPSIKRFHQLKPSLRYTTNNNALDNKTLESTDNVFSVNTILITPKKPLFQHHQQNLYKKTFSVPTTTGLINQHPSIKCMDAKCYEKNSIQMLTSTPTNSNNNNLFFSPIKNNISAELIKNNKTNQFITSNPTNDNETLFKLPNKMQKNDHNYKRCSNLSRISSSSFISQSDNESCFEETQQLCLLHSDTYNRDDDDGEHMVSMTSNSSNGSLLSPFNNKKCKTHNSFMERQSTQSGSIVLSNNSIIKTPNTNYDELGHEVSCIKEKRTRRVSLCLSREEIFPGMDYSSSDNNNGHINKERPVKSSLRLNSCDYDKDLLLSRTPSGLLSSTTDHHDDDFSHNTLPNRSLVRRKTFYAVSAIKSKKKSLTNHCHHCEYLHDDDDDESEISSSSSSNAPSFARSTKSTKSHILMRSKSSIIAQDYMTGRVRRRSVVALPLGTVQWSTELKKEDLPSDIGGSSVVVNDDDDDNDGWSQLASFGTLLSIKPLSTKLGQDDFTFTTSADIHQLLVDDTFESSQVDRVDVDTTTLKDTTSKRSNFKRIVVFQSDFFQRHHIIVTKLLIASLSFATLIDLLYSLYCDIEDSIIGSHNNNNYNLVVLSPELLKHYKHKTQLNLLRDPEILSVIQPNNKQEYFSYIILQHIQGYIQRVWIMLMYRWKHYPWSVAENIFLLIFLLPFFRHYDKVFDEPLPFEDGVKKVCNFIGRRILRIALICVGSWKDVMTTTINHVTCCKRRHPLLLNHE